MGTVAGDILRAVQEAVGKGPVPLQRPPLSETDTRQVIACMAKDPIGKHSIEAFEDDLTALTGAQYAVALSSGTAAIHMALVAAGVRPGDEVLCPSMTYAATANAIVHAGAIPHFLDSRSLDLAINPFKLRQYLGGGIFERIDGGLKNLRTERRVSALICVHLLGVPCDVFQIDDLCSAYKLPVIEDAAEALGSVTWSGKWAGRTGAIGCLSFNTNKIVTTGGGGAIITDDLIVASTVRHLSTQAKVKHPFHWIHDAVGYNYRMPNIAAALGLSQLRRLHKTLELKKDLHNKYRTAFGLKKTVTFLDAEGNHWLNACLIDSRHMKERDSVIQLLLDHGYGSRALFTPLHTLEHFKENPRQQNMAGSEDIWRRTVCLPSSIK